MQKRISLNKKFSSKDALTLEKARSPTASNKSNTPSCATAPSKITQFKLNVKPTTGTRSRANSIKTSQFDVFELQERLLHRRNTVKKITSAVGTPGKNFNEVYSEDFANDKSIKLNLKIPNLFENQQKRLKNLERNIRSVCANLNPETKINFRHYDVLEERRKRLKEFEEIPTSASDYNTAIDKSENQQHRTSTSHKAFTNWKRASLYGKVIFAMKPVRDTNNEVIASEFEAKTALAENVETFDDIHKKKAVKVAAIIKLQKSVPVVKKNGRKILDKKLFSTEINGGIVESNENLIKEKVGKTENFSCIPMDTQLKAMQMMECKNILKVFESKGLEDKITEKALVKSLVFPEEVLHKGPQKLKKKKERGPNQNYINSLSLSRKETLLKKLLKNNSVYSDNDSSDETGSNYSDSECSSQIYSEKKTKVSSAKLRKIQKRIQERNAKDWFNFPNIVARPVNFEELLEEQINNTSDKNRCKVKSYWKKNEFLKIKRNFELKKMTDLKSKEEKKLKLNTLKKLKLESRNVKNTLNGSRRFLSSKKAKTTENNLILVEKSSEIDESANNTWFPSFDHPGNLHPTSESLFGKTSNATSRVGSSFVRKVGEDFSGFLPQIKPQDLSTMHIQEFYTKYKPNVL
ncbi:hypothetical protein HDU92_007085 [Lobulomyces angularis]|nr:hypothetical protein HDU92_007085 [Lobulomyces angularis]